MSEIKEAVIVSAVRTPVGKFLGALKGFKATELGAIVVREGYRLGNGTLVDTVINDGLWCAFDDQHMGCTGEVVSERFHVSREEQDEYALNSHRKASAASNSGKFRDEIVAVEIKQRKGPPVIFDTDETVREDTSLESLGK